MGLDQHERASDKPEPGAGSEASSSHAVGAWATIKKHKVVEWTLAYVAAGFALVHALDLASRAFEWPLVVSRLTMIVWLVGIPFAVAIAWYHGHRAQHRLSTGELAILTVLLVIAGSILWSFSRRAPESPAAGSNPAATTAAPAIAPLPAVVEKSIAVLPLANESGEADQQYFSDGISEDLITALSQFQGLKVIGRTSAFQFRDSKEDSRSIGAKLGVAHLLEGSVQRSGDVVRVRAELIDTADGSTQWSDHYDRPYKDLFKLQDEITRAVTGALQAKLLPGEHAAAQSERPPGGSLEAYNALLQGRFYYRRETEADQREAIGYFTHATQLDPRYALAYSGLSRAWERLGGEFLQGGAPMQMAYANARAAVDRALALAPDLAFAHVARGELLQFADFNWRGAEAEYRRALELAPNDGEAKVSLGIGLASVGELEPAIALTRQALATEPLQATWYNWLAQYLSGLNRFDEAERAVRRAIELQPAAPLYSYLLTLIEVVRGDAGAALTAAQEASPGYFRDSALALARQIGGDRSAADTALKILIDRDAYIAAYPIADVYALRHNAEETFAWLDRALSNRDTGILGLLYDPFILRYKDDPRFAAFCHKVGLPAPRG